MNLSPVELRSFRLASLVDSNNSFKRCESNAASGSCGFLPSSAANETSYESSCGVYVMAALKPEAYANVTVRRSKERTRSALNEPDLLRRVTRVSHCSLLTLTLSGNQKNLRQPLPSLEEQRHTIAHIFCPELHD